MEAEHTAAPASRDPFVDLVPGEGVRLTPRHYALYLKISEGSITGPLLIVPSLRGRLATRSPGDVLREAERLVRAGVKELVVIARFGAYGLDIRYAEARGATAGRGALLDITRGSGSLTPGSGCDMSIPTRMSTGRSRL